jgi:hypothetical protein
MQVVRIDGESTGQHSAETVGTKATNLARMAALGLRVPPAFVLPIELCAGMAAPCATRPSWWASIFVTSAGRATTATTCS